MPRPSNVADLVADASAESPDKLALVEVGGRSLTWSQLDDEVRRTAAGLGRLGVRAGMRIMIVLGNRLEFVTSYLGALSAQVVAVPVNPGSTAYELARMLADSGARLVVADDDTAPAVREALAVLDGARAGQPVADGELEPELLARAQDPRLVVIGEPAGAQETTYDDLVAEPGGPLPALQDPESLAVLLYTSGASGRPRGAMLSHRALVANIEQVAAVSPPMIHGDDVVLGVLPLFHVYGLNAVLGGVLRHRAKLVLVDRFDPEGTLDLIDDEAVSVVPVAPPVLGYWMPVEGLRDRLGPVRLVLSGSAPLGAEVMDRFSEAGGVEVHQGYGLTEAAPVVTSTLCSARTSGDASGTAVAGPGAPAAGSRSSGSVGAALPGIELRLVDEHTGHLEGDDPGEIQVRGDNLFSGYWPDGSGGPDADGWYSTGDVGYLDADGDLYLVDRVRELVIVSGFNVYPSEVEDAVRDVEGVREVAVIGTPDQETGESVVAYVVATDGTDAAQVAEAVRERASRRLARFKQPARIEVVPELPRTATGKIQKGRLRGIERRRRLALLEQPAAMET
ncbi:class I adenylate-forming enzyme family protein [Nocardioides campestrisoli]|uniref:class I adenylate-forming enzyme family protein n=1 Tax=Nocardioides campestrisoli TaxID=2736757 RepID=UPI0015E71C53|nr:class I adenylate-forming enzyme family protein [Nocardioides campestrisoli]